MWNAEFCLKKLCNFRSSKVSNSLIYRGSDDNEDSEDEDAAYHSFIVIFKDSGIYILQSFYKTNPIEIKKSSYEDILIRLDNDVFLGLEKDRKIFSVSILLGTIELLPKNFLDSLTKKIADKNPECTLTSRTFMETFSTDRTEEQIIDLNKKDVLEIFEEEFGKGKTFGFTIGQNPPN